ncbi:MAG: hypothetical protein AB8B56_18715 [Crocinitomicaceae bacterium]
MKNVKRAVFFGLSISLLLGAASCGTTDEVTDEKPNESIAESMTYPIKNIADGYLTGNEQEGIGEGGLVINSQADWEALIAKMNSVNETIEEEPIDFNSMTVLTYFDQIRGSGGYTVDIVSVVKDGNKLVAKVKKTTPKEDAIEIMTQPFMIGFIQKTDLPIIFVD